MSFSTDTVQLDCIRYYVYSRNTNAVFLAIIRSTPLDRIAFFTCILAIACSTCVLAIIRSTLFGCNHASCVTVSNQL